MRRPSQIRSASWLVLLGAVLCAGCGPSLVKLQGRLQVNGAPFNPEGSETIVTLLGEDGGRQVSYPATVKADGTFLVQGPEGRGVPPGKYRVAVTSMVYGVSRGDRFGGEFASGKTPLSLEINSGLKEMTIDLVRKTVS